MLRHDRKFQVWRYTVGHKQMLLRSVKSEQAGTRIDVLFKAVEYICIPTTIENIVIEEVKGSTAPVLISSLGWQIPVLYQTKIFSVSGRHGSGYVSLVQSLIVRTTVNTTHPADLMKAC